MTSKIASRVRNKETLVPRWATGYFNMREEIVRDMPAWHAGQNGGTLMARCGLPWRGRRRYSSVILLCPTG